MCLALMGPGDTAIVPAPYFPVHTYAVALASGNVIALEVADSEKFLANIAYTCQHLYPKPKLLIICYPHNPSTVTVEPEFFVEVVKLAKRYGFMVISDFAYADVAFDGYQTRPASWPPRAPIDVGVEFTTMSKGYNMAGWRVGFCCGNAEMIQRPGGDQGLLRLRHVSGRSRSPRSWPCVTRKRRWNANRRSTGDVEMCWWKVSAGSAGTLTPPKAGMFVWAPIPEPWRQRMSTMDFAMMLLEKADVAVSPGSGFRRGGRRLPAIGLGGKRESTCDRPSAKSAVALRMRPNNLPKTAEGSSVEQAGSVSLNRSNDPACPL